MFDNPHRYVAGSAVCLLALMMMKVDVAWNGGSGVNWLSQNTLHFSRVRPSCVRSSLMNVPPQQSAVMQWAYSLCEDVRAWRCRKWVHKVHEARGVNKADDPRDDSAEFMRSFQLSENVKKLTVMMCAMKQLSVVTLQGEHSCKRE